MKNAFNQLYWTALTILCVLWPVSAYATQLSFDQELAQVPLLSLLMTLVLSTLMGATSLLHAMRHEYIKNNGVIHQLWLFVSSRMLGSNSAGLLMFFGPDVPYKAGCIMLAAFLGTVFLEKLSKKYLETQ